MRIHAYRRMFALLVCGLLATLTACQSGTTPNPTVVPAAIVEPQPTPVPVRPVLWVVTGADALVAGLPRATIAVTATTNYTGTIDARWQQPVVAWMNATLDTLHRTHTTPTASARTLAYVAVSMHDALIIADLARTHGVPTSDAAALTAAATTLSMLEPTYASQGIADAQQAAWAGVQAKRDTPTSVAVGLAIAQAVAQRVTAAAAADGSTAQDTWTLPKAAAGVWQPTAPNFNWPLATWWGTVQPIGAATRDQTVLAAPPPWDATAFVSERDGFKAAHATLSADDTQQVLTWLGGDDPRTAPEQWFLIARDLVIAQKLDSAPAANVFAQLGVALHTTTILSWRAAFTYNVARPLTWMQASSSPAWVPLVPTPSYPAYPSDSAAVSSAASTMLSTLFPADAATLVAQRDAAAHAPVAAGIGWELAVQPSIELGAHVAQAVIAQQHGGN